MVVQHMLSSERVRLRCRGTVLKLALLDRRLAVQLPDRLSIYQVDLSYGERPISLRLYN